MSEVAQCLSASCTTGWLDWVHGELWLSPTTLIRRRLSWTVSKTHGLGPTVSTPLPEVSLVEFDLAALVQAHPTNKVIRFDAVAGARLFSGMTADALRLTMGDGMRYKLLWLPRDPAYRVLSSALPLALGDRFSRARHWRT